jgi:hypothetical protein
MQSSSKQRQGVAVTDLRCRPKAFVKRTANNAVMIYQGERFIRDNFFELTLGHPGARDVRCPSLYRDMIDPMPTQGVRVDREFPRRSLDRRARRKKPFNPHALKMITPLTAPCS